jgi:hypothetical protein
MARFMTKELSRPEPGHFVELELAEDTLDAETVLMATLRALAAGEISTEAANGVARFVEACGRILGKGSMAKRAVADTEAESAAAVVPQTAAPASGPVSLQRGDEPCNSEEDPERDPAPGREPAPSVTVAFPPGLNRKARRTMLREQRRQAKRAAKPQRMAA